MGSLRLILQSNFNQQGLLRQIVRISSELQSKGHVGRWLRGMTSDSVKYMKIRRRESVGIFLSGHRNLLKKIVKVLNTDIARVVD